MWPRRFSLFSHIVSNPECIHLYISSEKTVHSFILLMDRWTILFHFSWVSKCVLTCTTRKEHLCPVPPLKSGYKKNPIIPYKAFRGSTGLSNPGGTLRSQNVNLLIGPKKTRLKGLKLLSVETVAFLGPHCLEY